jgi:hypothetical protein
VKKSNIYLGVSYYLGIMAAGATLSLDKKGYVFVRGYDRMEFTDIEETQSISCKLAKKLKLTTKEVKEHLNELIRSGIVKSEIESEMVHKLNCDREAVRGKVQAAADRLLSDE